MLEDHQKCRLEKWSTQILRRPFHLLSWTTQAHRCHLSLPRRYIRPRCSNFAEDRKDHIGPRSSESKRELHFYHFETSHQKVWVLRRDSSSFSFDHNEPEFQSFDLIVEFNRLLKWQRAHRASRLFEQPSAITVCCGYSKRAEIQRQCGIQEETEHVYSNAATNDSRRLIFLRSVPTLVLFGGSVVSVQTRIRLIEDKDL